jgi:hypothetical protein
VAGWRQANPRAPAGVGGGGGGDGGRGDDPGRPAAHRAPEDKAPFDRLAKVLKEQLSGIKVYKVGDEAERQLYIVGKTKDGQWARVKTTVVKT